MPEPKYMLDVYDLNKMRCPPRAKVIHTRERELVRAHAVLHRLLGFIRCTVLIMICSLPHPAVRTFRGGLNEENGYGRNNLLNFI